MPRQIESVIYLSEALAHIRFSELVRARIITSGLDAVCHINTYNLKYLELM